MNLPKRYIIAAVTVFTVTLFFGCESNFKEVQKINFSEFVPGSDADTVNIRYTDSGLITGVLKSPKMLDYSNLEFPLRNFQKESMLRYMIKNKSVLL